MPDTPAIHFDVTDPDTGDTFRLVAVKRKGQMHLQRLTPGLYDLAQATPRRLEHLRTFGAFSRRAAGSTMTEALPPGSLEVQRGLPEAAKHYRNPRQSRVKDHQAYYRALVGERDFDLAAVSLGVKDVREIARVPFQLLALPPTIPAKGNSRFPRGPPPI